MHFIETLFAGSTVSPFYDISDVSVYAGLCGHIRNHHQKMIQKNKDGSIIACKQQAVEFTPEKGFE